MNSNEARKVLLQRIADYVLPIEPTLEELASFPFDCEESLVAITREHLKAVVNRYLAGEITAEQITDWADLIECREGFDEEKGFEKALHEAIFELANPNLTQSVTKESVEALLARVLNEPKPKFTWGDLVLVEPFAEERFRPNQLGSICGITDAKDREGNLVYEYTVEYGDGSDQLIPEKFLRYEP